MASFAALSKLFQGSEEERLCSQLLFNDTDVKLGDQRLNNIAALTYNSASCQRIFNLLEKTLSPTENPWKTIYKALLLLHTIVLYGSELAIDKAIQLCRFVYPLINYNSALVKKSWFSGSGGTDYGAPVRAEAQTLNKILVTDEGIRTARATARAGQESLVPMGEAYKQPAAANATAAMTYGQGMQSSMGAGFDLSAVPGMYDGRPERYFDSRNDPRSYMGSGTTRDHQITRDAQAPSLLDLVFDSPANDTAALPPADYLPALERQKQLEQQLALQQEQLRKLQELHQQQAMLQQQQQQQQFNQMQQHQQHQFVQNVDPAANILNMYSTSSTTSHYTTTAAPVPSAVNSLLDFTESPAVPPQQQQPYYGAMGAMQQPISQQYPQQHQFPGSMMTMNTMQTTPSQYPQYSQQQQNSQQRQQQRSYGGDGLILPIPQGPPPPLPSMPPPP